MDLQRLKPGMAPCKTPPRQKAGSGVTMIGGVRIIPAPVRNTTV